MLELRCGRSMTGGVTESLCPVQVLQRWGERLAGVPVPDAGRAVPARGQHAPPIRAERGVGDGSAVPHGAADLLPGGEFPQPGLATPVLGTASRWMPDPFFPLAWRMLP